MFGKKKTKSVKDSYKCTTKNKSNNCVEKTKDCHNTKASNMTSGSRSTKSCGAKSLNSVATRKSSSSSAAKSCGAKNCN